ncbi:hypothetical protein ACA910_005610 [Epithemia clementina (nom. ined.)]
MWLVQFAVSADSGRAPTPCNMWKAGYCRGCRGKDTARQEIYNYASSKKEMKRYLTLNNVPMIEDGGHSYRNEKTMPDKPYYCLECQKNFRNLSQFLVHKNQKHGNRRMITF